MFSFSHPIRSIMNAVHQHGKALADALVKMISSKFPIAGDMAQEIETLVETHLSAAAVAIHSGAVAAKSPPPPPSEPPADPGAATDPPANPA